MKYLRKQYVTLSRPLGISLAPEGCGDSVYKNIRKKKIIKISEYLRSSASKK